MTNYPWRKDVDNMPKGSIVETVIMRDGKEIIKQVFKPETVIVAVQGVVTLSRWLPPQKDRPAGRWDMLATGQQPEAWMPWPEYPEEFIGEGK